ncbi:MULTISPECIES: oxidoreductase [Isoptericola]|nr:MULTISPECIES: oxidoreductase [Isoptericola]MCK0118327.1 oxidoreductase [Isoptericola sp. S6320L]
MSLRSAMDRLLGRSPSSSSSAAPSGGGRAAAVGHLQEFVRSRVGVEAYVEPPNAQTPATVLLVATTGEWTRRRVPDERTGFDVARSLGVPVYNVRFTGYPQRMRDWNSAQRAERRRGSASS